MVYIVRVVHGLGWPTGWVGLGWIGLGLGREFVFSELGWVVGLNWQICEKQMSGTYVTLYCQAIILLRENLQFGASLHLLYWWLCCYWYCNCCYLHWHKCILMMIMVMMCTSVSSYARPFLVCCMGVGLGLVGYGLGWVMGSTSSSWVSYFVGWVGFGSMKWTHG